jgi:hypothetical protein
VSLRSHGQILRTGDALTPDEASLTSTVWIGGVFHSMVTQGHVSINRLLSTTHGYLGLFRSYGQRIFVELEDGYALLDAPSAFEMTPRSARWIYRTASGLFQVRSWAAVAHHELWLRVDVLEGPPRRFLLSNHLAVNGDDGAEAVPARVSRDAHGFAVGLLPDTDLGRRFPDGSFRFDPAHGTEFEQVGGDELLFEDGSSRGLPFIVFVARATRSLGVRITGQLLGNPPREPARDASACAADDADAAHRYWSRMTGPLDLRRDGESWRRSPSRRSQRSCRGSRTMR